MFTILQNEHFDDDEDDYNLDDDHDGMHFLLLLLISATECSMNVRCG